MIGRDLCGFLEPVVEEAVRIDLPHVLHDLEDVTLQGWASSRRIARAVESAGRGCRGEAALGSDLAVADRNVHSTPLALQHDQFQHLKPAQEARKNHLESGN